MYNLLKHHYPRAYLQIPTFFNQQPEHAIDITTLTAPTQFHLLTAAYSYTPEKHAIHYSTIQI